MHGSIGCESIWKIVRIGVGLSACIEGGWVGVSDAGTGGAIVGCLVGLAFDLGAEQTRHKIEKMVVSNGMAIQPGRGFEASAA